MMIRRILTIGTVAAAVAAVCSHVEAQQVYQSAPGAYSPAPHGYPIDARGNDQGPDFDSMDDEEASGTALPPPGPAMSDDPRYGRPVYAAPQGPVMSPDDPRYGRPANAPVYSAAPQGPVMSPDDPRYGRPAGAPVYGAVPQGPVMSPDDPRYGRPAGPPPVIYGDRQAPGQQIYGNAGYGAPASDAGAMRPPGAVGGAAEAPAAAGPGNRPMTVASLPPEEQPDAAPAELPANLRRQEVAFVTKEPPGTIVVDTPNTYLYLVLGGGRAMRYGVRVGREGFTWTGVQKISKKTEWPDWYPPSEMIERQPYLPRFMAGGPGNPLGARAMYLGSTVYRIHGTNQPSTIGKFVSSGCIGMLNDDVSDLFGRVKVGTRVVVMPGGARPSGNATTASAAPLPAAGAAPAPAPMQAQANVPAQPASMQPLPPPVTIR